MKTYIFLFLLFASRAFASDAVLDAVDAAYATAQSHPAKVAPAAISGASSWTLRTDLYAGPRGSGFQVVATLTLLDTVFSIRKQSGPETTRQNMPDLAAFKKSVHAGIDAQYATRIARGIKATYGDASIVLSASEADQNAFNRLLNLLNTAPMPGTVTITDNRGIPHAVQVVDVYTILGSYGQQIAALWSGYVTAKASVNSAGTFAQLAP